MNDKIDNLKDLQYFSNITMLCELVLQALDKQQTEKLKSMSQALTQISFYVNNLQEDRKMYNKALSEYRADKHRAIDRAQAAEKKVEELEEELKKVNIFGKLNK